MTFDEVVGKISRRLQKKKNREFLKMFFEAVKTTVRKQGRFVIPDFIVFNVKPTKKRKIHNPITGVEMVLPVTRTVRTRASKTWRTVK